MAFVVATWNVNSVRRRLDGLGRLASSLRPDVLCLQETKVIDDEFPRAALADMGYAHQAVHGIKSYNGVAILSRWPLLRWQTRAWLGLAEGRHVFATVAGPPGLEALEIHSLYVPAGGDDPNPERNPRFARKLKFLDAMTRWSRTVGRSGRSVVLAGDFNVAPLPTDVWDHKRLKSVITHTPGEVARLEAIQTAGAWIDGVRHFIPPAEHCYTWWSYRAPDWKAANKGRRLDHIWVSPPLEPCLSAMVVLRESRGWDPPSDHVPVAVTLC